MTKKNIILSIVLISISGVILYSNALKGEFIWDDRNLIRDNFYIRDLSGFFRFLTGGISSGAGSESSFYRPVQMLSYFLGHCLWGLDVRGYHLTNIMLHILVALALFWFLALLFDDWLLSFLAGVLFIAHPIHTEAVAYISGRADPLAALFILLCFIFYIRYERNQNKLSYALILVSYIMALLSRENALILPLLLIIYHISFQKKIKRITFLPISGVAFAYILFRFTALRFMLSHLSYKTTFVQRIPGVFIAISTYIKLLILPFDLHMIYGKGPFSITDPRAIGGIFIVFLLLYLAWRKRKEDRIVFFSICWFFIALIPVSNLYPINAYMAEHWLYLPSMGFFLSLAYILSSLYRLRKLKIVAIFLSLFLFCFYSFLTIRQNTYWREPIPFYERTLRFSPECTNLYVDLGLEYNAAGKTDRAIVILEKAIEIDPKYTEAYNSLGSVYDAAGRTKDAERMFKKAIEINPNYARAYNNLAIFYFYNRKYGLAIKYADQAQALGFINPELLEQLKPYRK
ncbi:MAG: tetratricopeptide repeat protein [Candidatus Omnitrophica bacterium]|nr:tetratricopeptide repeat protein [Candidatus Omnitrophota bacterium]